MRSLEQELRPADAESLPLTPEALKGEVEKIDTKIEDELRTLNESRAKFAMPPLDTSVEVERLREQRNKLASDYEAQTGQRLEKGAEQEKSPTPQAEIAKETEVEQQERARLEKKLANVEESFTRLSRILQRRESERLSPLLEAGGISAVSFGARSLSESVKTGTVDYENIAQSLGAIRRGLEDFGQQRQFGAVREDGDSLRAVTASLQDAADNLERLRASLAESNDPQANEAAALIGSVRNVLEDAYYVTSRRRQLFSEYSR